MSDLGSLSHCMTDADAESMARSRRLRRKSLLTSLSFEAALVALLMLWPLFSPSALGRHMEVLPLPPLHFSRPSIAERAPTANNNPRPGVSITPVFTYHPVSSGHSALATDDAPPSGDPLGIDAGFPSIGPLTTAGGGTSVVPPPGAPKSKPPRISVGTMDGSLVHRVQPEYPAIAKAMRARAPYATFTPSSRWTARCASYGF